MISETFKVYKDMSFFFFFFNWEVKFPNKQITLYLDSNQPALYIGFIRIKPKPRPSGESPRKDIWTRGKDSAPRGQRDIRCNAGIRDNLHDGATEDQRTAGDKRRRAGDVMFFSDCQGRENKEALTR